MGARVSDNLFSSPGHKICEKITFSKLIFESYDLTFKLVKREQ